MEFELDSTCFAYSLFSCKPCNAIPSRCKTLSQEPHVVNVKTPKHKFKLWNCPNQSISKFHHAFSAFLPCLPWVWWILFSWNIGSTLWVFMTLQIFLMRQWNFLKKKTLFLLMCWRNLNLELDGIMMLSMTHFTRLHMNFNFTFLKKTFDKFTSTIVQSNWLLNEIVLF